MQVNDRVTVKTDGGPRRSGVVLAIESFSEGTMYLVSLEDYPLGIWFFNEIGHRMGFSWKKRSRKTELAGAPPVCFSAYLPEYRR